MCFDLMAVIFFRNGELTLRGHVDTSLPHHGVNGVPLLQGAALFWFACSVKPCDQASNPFTGAP